MREPSWLDDYRKRGFVHFPAVLNEAEVDELRRESSRVSELPGILDPDNLRTRISAREVQHTIDRIDPVVDLSPAFNRLGSDPRILDPVIAAVGEPVAFVKDKLILKPPGAGGYGMHQDSAYYPVGVEIAGRGVAVMIALDGSSADNGALELVPGAHHRLLTPVNEPADCDPAELPDPEIVAVDPGDVVMFSLLTPHRSGPNRSTKPRRTLFFSYVPADGTDQRAAFYEAQRQRFIDQLPPERRANADFR